jgi:hypothetical protein
MKTLRAGPIPAILSYISSSLGWVYATTVMGLAWRAKRSRKLACVRQPKVQPCALQPLKRLRVGRPSG